MSTIVIKRSDVKTKVVALCVAVVASVILPQIFHVAGQVSGMGASLGASMLPMHIPVFTAGLLFGPVVGFFAGLISPIISFAISGMPVESLLPYIAVELCVYGLICGTLHKTKMPVFIKLLVAQIAGRAVRALMVVAAVYLFESGLALTSIISMITTAIPGILLQWALIPLLVHRIEGYLKNDE